MKPGALPALPPQTIDNMAEWVSKHDGDPDIKVEMCKRLRKPVPRSFKALRALLKDALLDGSYVQLNMYRDAKVRYAMKSCTNAAAATAAPNCPGLHAFMNA